jgi:acyl-CoA thioester hydrolase
VASFIHQAATRFSDTDAMGHVNHARALAYLEDARIALLAAAASGGTDLGVSGVILAHLEVDYVREVHVAMDPIEVEVWVERIGRSSVAIGYSMRQDGEEALRASTVLVAFDYSVGKSRGLTDAERASLERFRRSE